MGQPRRYELNEVMKMIEEQYPKGIYAAELATMLKISITTARVYLYQLWKQERLTRNPDVPAGHRRVIRYYVVE